MKKIFKFRTILIAIITVFSFMVLFSIDNAIVRAEEGYGSCVTPDGALSVDKGACKKIETHGTLTITKEGRIDITHDKGITEFIILAEACGVKKEDGNGKVTCDDGDTWTGKKVVIHGSGSSKSGYKTVYLYKYFNIGTLVRVKYLYDFISETKTFKKGEENGAESGQYKTLYCDLNIPRYECGRFYNDTNIAIEEWELKNSIDGNNYLIDNLFNMGKMRSDYSIKTRVAKLMGNVKYSLEKLDKNGIVYNGSGLSSSLAGGVYVLVDNTGADKAKLDVDDIIYDTIIPTLLIVLGIAATITVVVLGVQIIRGADDSSERSEKIKRLRGILIGLAIAFCILVLIEPVVELTEKYLMKDK